MPTFPMKTYRRDEQGRLHYLEAWVDRGSFVTHRGKVGTVGSNTRHAVRSAKWWTSPTLEEHVAVFEERARTGGFEPIPDEDHGSVVLQIWTHSDDLSHPDDDVLLTDVTDALDDFVGWRGVGHCDGNDAGGPPPAGYELSGTVLNLFCPVVDTTIGVGVVRRFAKQAGLTQLWVIGVQEPGPDAAHTLAHSPRKRDTEFLLFRT